MKNTQPRTSVPETLTELQSPPRKPRGIKRFLFFSVLVTGVFLSITWPRTDWRESFLPKAPIGSIAPLAMSGGNPYVRAMLRTISASESNDASPYTLLYGGSHFEDLSQHPDQCLPIVAGPNKGLCTTAAGRYQFLTTTWQEKADLYHPNPDGMLFWKNYSYEAQYQDRVVYNWLSDNQAWGVDIPQLLEDGEVDRVLRLLSGTWTSLGYGIEDNWFTPYLPGIYSQLLEDELTVQASQSIGNAIEPNFNFRQ